VFCEGGSIPYDMGGYYVHALVSLLGPIKRVTGFASPFKPEITHRNPRHPDYHVPIPFKANTTMSAALEFHSNVYANWTVTSESHLMEVPRLEIYGTEGTLILPDPNTFAGPVKLIRGSQNMPLPIPLTHGYAEDEPDPGTGSFEERIWRNCNRGIGVADLAWAIRNNRPHRCSAELGLHAIEVIYGVEQSCKEEKIYTLLSKPAQPKALPAGHMHPTAAEECFDTD
jgi:predicted dehydrogenase